MAYPQQYRFMFMTSRPAVAPEGEEAVDPARNAYLFLQMTLAQAIEEGRLRPELSNADLVAQTVWAAMHGVVSLQIAMGCEEGWIDWKPIEKRTAAMMDLIFRALLPEGAAQRTPARKATAKGRR